MAKKTTKEVKPRTVKEKKRALQEYIKTKLLAGQMRYHITSNINKGIFTEDLDEDVIEYVKGLSFSYISDIVSEAYDSCTIENDEDRKAQLELMYSRFLDIYRKAVEDNNLVVAKQTLDSLSKLLGLNEADKIQVTTENISIKLI